MSGFEKLPAIGLHSRPTRRIDRFRPIEQVGRCVDLADLPALIGQGHQDSCVQDHFVRALPQQPAQRASAPTQSDERTPAIAFGDRPRPQRPNGSPRPHRSDARPAGLMAAPDPPFQHHRSSYGEATGALPPAAQPCGPGSAQPEQGLACLHRPRDRLRCQTREVSAGQYRSRETGAAPGGEAGHERVRVDRATFGIPDPDEGCVLRSTHPAPEPVRSTPGLLPVLRR